MRILVDRDVPCADEAFGEFGTVTAVPPEAIPDAVGTADALVVRSTTRVDGRLLAGTPVRFVGSTTSGVDHVDARWLAAHGIAFAAAPGCNAEAVAQYVGAALAVIRERLRRPLRGRTIGIVGVGNTGERVARIARALGLTPVLCDPPRARATGSAAFRPLRELAGCDVVSLHVPLARDGPDRTLGLVDAAFLRAMSPESVLINTARGEVVDERALRAALGAGRLAGAVIDVWRDEPAIDAELLAVATLATPHVAGHSQEGKLRGTEAIHSALAAFTGTPSRWSAAPLIAEGTRTVGFAWTPASLEERTCALLRESHALERDDRELRALLTAAPGERAGRFRALRAGYPVRREFAATQVRLDPFDAAPADRLAALGFTVVAPGVPPEL